MDFEYKREAAKFCSDKCRVQYNRKNPPSSVTKTQMQVLYNATLELMGKIHFAPPQEVYDSPKMNDRVPDEAPLNKPVLKVAAEAIMRAYVEEKREATCEADYFAWLEKLEAETRLTSRQKELVKSTN